MAKKAKTTEKVRDGQKGSESPAAAAPTPEDEDEDEFEGDDDGPKPAAKSPDTKKKGAKR